MSGPVAPPSASNLSGRPVADPRSAPGPSADWTDGSGEQSFSFSDFLSIINPLQHIPVVGTLYRAITGDTVKPAPKVIGGLLFGGPVGLVSAAFNAILEQTTGKDLGDQALALFRPTPSAPVPEPPPQYAAARKPAALVPPELGAEAAPASPAPLDDDPVAEAVSAQPGLPIARRGRLLAGGPRAAALGASGRTLVDYRAAGGRPLPVIDNARGPTGAQATAPVRLQTTSSLPERVAASSRDATEEANSGERQTDPFVAAMMRGLDRYREMKQAQNKAAPTVINAEL